MPSASRAQTPNASAAAEADSDRVVLHRDESRRTRHAARWVLRGLLAAALAVTALGNGGASWTPVAVAWLLLVLAVAPAVLAVPNKPPRLRLGWLWWFLGLLVALQLVPLPRGLVAVLQPMAVTLSDAGRAALDLPPAPFLPLALAPGDAALQGAVYLLGGAFALLGSIALSGHDGRRAVHWAINVVLVVAGISGFAWVCAYTSPFTDFVPGGLAAKLSRLCFVNPNQEAALLNLAIAGGMGRMRLAINPRWQMVFGSLALFLALVVLEVGSRGGIMATCLILTLTVFTRAKPVVGRRIDRRDLQRAALIRNGVLIASIALAAAIIALPAIDREFSATADSHKFATMGRMIGLGGKASGAVSIFREIGPLGAGPGGLPVLAGMDPQWGGLRVDFAENLALDAMIAVGIVPGLLFLLALLATVIGWQRRRADTPQAPGPLIACVAVIVANAVDFSLQLSGVLLAFLATATALERIIAPIGGRTDLEAQRLPLHRRVLVASSVGLAVAGGLLFTALNALARNSEAVLQHESAEEAKTLIAKRFLADHHAFYRYGRKLYDKRDYVHAARAFDRAVALRPSSDHAHLFRFAAHLALGDAKVAGDDLRWLLDRDDEIVQRAMKICVASRAAEAVLIDITPRGADQSLRVARMVMDTRPDLVERVALALRERVPNRQFAIELARGELYLRREKLEAAKRIAANLLADVKTRDLGYLLEAQLLQHDHKFYEAFHLFREACVRLDNAGNACNGAIESIIAANHPQEALAYLNSRAPHMQAYTTHAGYFWYSKGRVALQTAHLEDALEAFRRAHGFVPDDMNVLIALARTCTDMGLRDEARALIDEALTKQPKLESALQLSKELDREAHHAFDTVRSVDPTPSTLDP